MNKPHVHAEIIKAWADGHVIQFWDERVSQWSSCGSKIVGAWDPEMTYRVRPETEIVLEECVSLKGTEYQPYSEIIKSIHPNNLRLTFDRETKKLLRAEVIYAKHLPL